MGEHEGDGHMPSIEKLLEEVTGLEGVDLEEALDPAEPEGVYRDSRQCAALALAGGTLKLLLSPPTPRPKKG
ncbi:Hypothetical Protein SCO [Streptomyces leeuwenhoekii]|uniref:Uncharacterized protein n=2 Tax=Streptomyces leeuwenhoekii TaxID=1437453 RepID=A0A0F7VLZ6_STRLW|nr:Hypothetical Protein SCO [Streptomyces leeuwenhoekii]